MRINPLQLKMTTLQSTDTQAFQNIAKDIITLSHDVLSTNNNVLHSECMPQIEQLCLYLNNKHPFYTQEDNFAIYKFIRKQPNSITKHNMERLSEHMHVPQQHVTTLQIIDMHLFSTILANLLLLSHDIIEHNNCILQCDYIPQIDTLYTQLYNKIKGFINTYILHIHQ